MLPLLPINQISQEMVSPPIHQYTPAKSTKGTLQGLYHHSNGPLIRNTDNGYISDRHYARGYDSMNPNRDNSLGYSIHSPHMHHKTELFAPNYYNLATEASGLNSPRFYHRNPSIINEANNNNNNNNNPFYHTRYSSMSHLSNNKLGRNPPPPNSNIRQISNYMSPSNGSYLLPVYGLQQPFPYNGDADIDYDGNQDKFLGIFEKQQMFLSNIAQNLAEQTNERKREDNKKMEEKIRKLEMEAMIKEHERKLQEILKEKDQQEIKLRKKKIVKKPRQDNNDGFGRFLESYAAEKLLKTIYDDKNDYKVEEDDNTYQDKKQFYRTNGRKRTQTDRTEYSNNYRESEKSFKNENIQSEKNYSVQAATNQDETNSSILTKKTSPFKQFFQNERRNALDERDKMDIKNLLKNLNLQEKKSKKDEEEEEKISKLDEKKQKLKRHLRIVLWVMAYCPLLQKESLLTIVEKHEKLLKDVHTSLGHVMDTLEKLFLNQLITPLTELYKESKSLCLINGLEKGMWSTKNLSESDLDERTNIICQRVSKILNALINITTLKYFTVNILRFCCVYAEEHGILPKAFMFEFEIKRLTFSYHAFLKGMNSYHSKMLIGLLILFRLLIFKFIFKPWSVVSTLKETDQKLALNQKTVGSIMFHIIIDFYKNNLPIIPKNQDFLPPQMKVRFREPFKLSDDSKLEEQILTTQKSKKDLEKKKEEETVLKGAFDKDSLKCFFVDRKKKADDLKALVECWHTTIYDLVHEYYKQELAKRKK